jgi:hypothetical protein
MVGWWGWGAQRLHHTMRPAACLFAAPVGAFVWPPTNTCKPRGGHSRRWIIAGRQLGPHPTGATGPRWLRRCVGYCRPDVRYGTVRYGAVGVRGWAVGDRGGPGAGGPRGGKIENVLNKITPGGGEV